MSETDKFPTVKEIMEGADGVTYPDGAYHDPTTGMYVAPEPTPSDVPEMILDQKTGLHLPRPKWKQVTRLQFDTGLIIDVSEDHDTVYTAVKEHKTGDLTFTGPVFNDPVVIRSSHVKRIMLITPEYRDLEDVELKFKQQEFNNRMIENQLASARAQSLGLLGHNHSQENSRRSRRMN